MVTKEVIEKLKHRNERNEETEIFLNDGLIDIKIDGEEYKGLTPQEVAQRFGTNYFVMQNLRYLFDNNQEIEETIKQEQSVKKQIIDIFIKTLEKNNIFEGKMSIEEIRDKLDKNINGAYITNEGYRKKIGGFFQNETKDLYVLSQGNLNPEELKQAVLNGNIEELIDMDRLGVICHETLHSLSDTEKSCGLQNNEYPYEGRAINEGITQFLTEQMLPSSYKTYKKDVETAKYLCQVFGEDVIKEAYLKGDFNYLLNIAKEKNIESELMELVILSDYRHEKEHSDETYIGTNEKKEIEELDNKIEFKKVEIIKQLYFNKEISEEEYKEYVKKNSKIISEQIMEDVNDQKKWLIEFMLYDIDIPSSAEAEMFFVACSSFIEEYGDEKLQKYIGKHPGIVSSFGKEVALAINQKNDYEFNIEDYIKYRFAYENPNVLAKGFLDKEKDINKYYKMICDSIGMLEEYEGENAQVSVMNLLECGFFNEKENQTFNKSEITSGMIFPEAYMGENFITNDEKYFECSWQERLSKMSNLEYYKTEKGTFIVDSKSGEIMAVNVNGEIVNTKEESKLEETGKEDRSENAIKYSSEDKGEQIFFTEKREDGKYVLKGYTKDENGKYIEQELDLGRNFFDDTTEIDRQITSETSEITSGNIKKVVETIKNEHRQNNTIKNREEDKGDESR